MTDKPLFEIGAAGVDTAAIVESIRAIVAEKTASGVYTDARIARAERTNLMNLKDEDGYLAFYLECLRDAVFVDINDFEILERRRGLGGILVNLKRAIWTMLKFYTYRLWSQQNRINGFLLSAIEAMETKYQGKIKELEAKIAQLQSENKTR